MAGGTHKPKELPNPAPEWLSERSWGEVMILPSLEKFASFAEEFDSVKEGFKVYFDSQSPHL